MLFKELLGEIEYQNAVMGEGGLDLDRLKDKVDQFMKVRENWINLNQYNFIYFYNFILRI